jgi:hypothetical protein
MSDQKKPEDDEEEPTPGEEIYAVFANQFYAVATKGFTRIVFGESVTGRSDLLSKRDSATDGRCARIRGVASKARPRFGRRRCGDQNRRALSCRCPSPSSLRSPLSFQGLQGEARPFLAAAALVLLGLWPLYQAALPVKQHSLFKLRGQTVSFATTSLASS